MDVFDFHYTCAELERDGVNLADRDVIQQLVGQRMFHSVFAPLDDEARINELVNGPLDSNLVEMVRVFEREDIPRMRRQWRRHMRYKKGAKRLRMKWTLDWYINLVRWGTYERDEDGTRYETYTHRERPAYPGNEADALYGRSAERYNEWNGACQCHMCRTERRRKASEKDKLTRQERLMLRLERLGDPMVTAKGE